MPDRTWSRTFPPRLPVGAEPYTSAHKSQTRAVNRRLLEAERAG